MTRDGTRQIAAFVVAVLATLLLAACGGSDTTDESDSTATETSAQNAGSGAGGQSDSKQAQSAPAKKKSNETKGGGNSGDAAGSPSGGSSSFDEAVPLQISGGGSSQFRVKGGDNSIQEYGDEADEEELAQAAEALYGYLLARVDEDWARACTYLAQQNVEQLEELGSQSPQLKNKGCAPVVKALSGGTLPDSTKRELTEVNAASLRVDSDGAFLIYHGARNTGYFSRMIDEGGTWKVAALAPTAFP